MEDGYKLLLSVYIRFFRLLQTEEEGFSSRTSDISETI